MTGTELILAICLAAGNGSREPASLQVDTPAFRATITSGCLDSLETAKGEKLVQRSQTPAALTIHREGAESAATVTTGPDKLGVTPVTLTHTGFAGPEKAEAKTLVRLDASTGDLILEPSVSSDKPGIWGLQWSIGRIPLDYAIIVPGHSGLRLTRHMPAEQMQSDYPQSWEAQLVIVEGRPWVLLPDLAMVRTESSNTVAADLVSLAIDLTELAGRHIDLELLFRPIPNISHARGCQTRPVGLEVKVALAHPQFRLSTRLLYAPSCCFPPSLPPSGCFPACFSGRQTQPDLHHGRRPGLR